MRRRGGADAGRFFWPLADRPGKTRAVGELGFGPCGGNGASWAMTWTSSSVEALEGAVEDEVGAVLVVALWADVPADVMEEGRRTRSARARSAFCRGGGRPSWRRRVGGGGWRSVSLWGLVPIAAAGRGRGRSGRARVGDLAADLEFGEVAGEVIDEDALAEGGLADVNAA